MHQRLSRRMFKVALMGFSLVAHSVILALVPEGRDPFANPDRSIKQLSTAKATVRRVDEDIYQILAKPEGQRMEALRVSQRNHKQILDELLATAFDKKEDYDIRWKALALSAQLGGVRALKKVESACLDKTWFMRNACLVSLPSINKTRAQKMAIKLLSDRALVVRSAAVEELHRSLTEESRQALWDELNQARNFVGKTSLWIRGQILEVLAETPKLEEKSLFEQLALEQDSRVKNPAKIALVQLQHSSL